MLSWSHRHEGWRGFRRLLLYGLAFLTLFSAWPVRNYLQHQRLILTRDLGPRYGHLHQPDVAALFNYIRSFQVDAMPQFEQIRYQDDVPFPQHAVVSAEDHPILQRALRLARTCSPGFRQWPGQWADEIKEPECSHEVAHLFTHLTQRQLEGKPFRVQYLIPLKRMMKFFLKNQLYPSFTRHKAAWIHQLVSILLYCRMILLGMGLLGLLVMTFKQNTATYPIHILVAVYGGSILLWLSHQHVFDMRYVLFLDILMLLPCTALIVSLKRFSNNTLRPSSLPSLP